MAQSTLLLTTARRLHLKGDIAGAERLYRQVLAADAGHVQAALSLGRLLLERREFDEAARWLGLAANRRTPDAESLALLGQCHFGLRRMAEAGATFEMALRADPRSRQARLGLARTLAATSQSDAALSVLSPLLAAGSDADALEAAGQACVAVGRNDEASGHFQAAAKIRPSAGLLTDLAWALNGSGRLEDALAHFDAALVLDPNSSSAAAGRANTLLSLGRTDEARGSARAAVDRDPTNPIAAVVFARLHRAPGARDEAVRSLESALRNPNAAPSQRASVLFTLGSLRDAAGEYDLAFECFRAANELGGGRFDAADYERAMREVMDVFSAAALQKLPRSSIHDPAPVFIVGMPRSGTSLVEQILASHPAVYGGGELDDLTTTVLNAPRILGLGAGARFPAYFGSLGVEQMNRLAKIYLDRIHELGGTAARITDKMPRHFAILGAIDRFFPGARVIHCVRDPIDTCLSCYSTHFGPAHGYTNRLSDLAAVYRVYRAMMGHWRSVLSIPIMDVRYEELVEQTEEGARVLVEFVGLPWDERCLRFHESTRVVHTASIDQVRRPIYRSSVQRWKNYERHLGELIEGLRGLD